MYYTDIYLPWRYLELTKFIRAYKYLRSEIERAASPGKGLFKGSGVLPQQAKTNFRRQRWKSVLSVCIYKRPACPVAHIGSDGLLPKVVMTILVTTKINGNILPVGGGSLTLQAVSLFPQRLETAVPGVAGNRCFCLLGSIPNPLNRPLRWSGCAAFCRFPATARC